MPIQEFSAVRSRNRIGLADEDPTPEMLTSLDGYEAYRFGQASLAESGLLATTVAVVFRQSSARPRQVADQLGRWAPVLLQYGCLVFVQPLPAEAGTFNQQFRMFIVQAINDLQLPATGLTVDEFRALDDWVDGPDRPKFMPLVRVLEQSIGLGQVVSYLQQYPPGKARTSGLQVEFQGTNGSRLTPDAEHLLLVQRAFADSEKVLLEKLPNGLSGVDAYRAYVHQRHNLTGNDWPYRYFIKIGLRSKVATEYMKYRDVALEHLPYHLGPRLRIERCELGYRSGIIVSDYVGGAVPLRDCTHDGRAPAAIANLFNVTFRAWHNGAKPSDVSLQKYLAKRVLPRIPDARKPLIKRYGAKRSLEELGKLLVAGDSRPVSIGVIHGDLHATNVLVRGDDAILIDFEQVEKDAPLLRDLACLEGGLFVDGFVGDGRTPKAILQSVECLYESKSLLKGRVDPCQPVDGSAWFFDCVMQIRMQARQHELADHQYALVLAAELMRKACNDHDFDADAQNAGKTDARTKGHRKPGTNSVPVRMEQTRAMAYVLAERILVGLHASHGQTKLTA